MRKGHTPIRTCISCGAKRPKKELIRLVLDSGGIVIKDNRGICHGRGAYVCLKRSCRERLRMSGRLGRAFRKNSPLTLHPELEHYEWDGTEK